MSTRAGGAGVGGAPAGIGAGPAPQNGVQRVTACNGLARACSCLPQENTATRPAWNAGGTIAQCVLLAMTCCVTVKLVYPRLSSVVT